MYSLRGVINIIDIDIAYFLLKRKMFQFVVGEREREGASFKIECSNYGKRKRKAIVPHQYF